MDTTHIIEYFDDADVVVYDSKYDALISILRYYKYNFFDMYDRYYDANDSKQKELMNRIHEDISTLCEKDPYLTDYCGLRTVTHIKEGELL